MAFTSNRLQTRLGTCLPLPRRSRFLHHKNRNIELRLIIPLTFVVTSPLAAPTSPSLIRLPPSFFHQYALAHGLAAPASSSTTDVYSTPLVPHPPLRTLIAVTLHHA